LHRERLVHRFLRARGPRCRSRTRALSLFSARRRC
jgi:hypothetical protein